MFQDALSPSMFRDGRIHIEALHHPPLYQLSWGPIFVLILDTE
jgi:hypothetical protein